MAFGLSDALWITPIGAAANIAAGKQPDDMKALNDYMARTMARTTDGQRLKTEWNTWFHDLSWYQKNFDANVWMDARNKVAKFNVANATTPDEKAEVEKVQKTAGLVELERLAAQGKTAPIDVSTGLFTTSEGGEGVKMKWLLLGSTFSLATGIAAYVSPVAKIPLGATSLLSLLGTGTYAAFKIDK